MSNRHQQVEQAIRKRRELVNRAFPERLPIKRPEHLYEASRYLLDAGGKRLRPTVLLLVAESLTDTEPLSADYDSFPRLDGERIDLLSAAIAIEVIQTFTLIHDDIMDDDDLRRGVPSVHTEYDLSTAILSGDTLYSKAFEFLLGTGAAPERTVRANTRLAETCTGLCEGQSLDMGFEERAAIDTEEYLDMVERKTAILYGASASIPATLLGADEETVTALYNHGVNIGKAFQIQDDLLDLTTPSEKLGKQRGSDLVEGKQTLITVHARQQGVDIDGLIETESVESVSESEIDDAVVRLQDAGSIEYAREQAHELVSAGKENLHVLPDNEARDMLSGIADYLVEREY
jgi:geranylgeranyl diphosphate synthase type I